MGLCVEGQDRVKTVMQVQVVYNCLSLSLNVCGGKCDCYYAIAVSSLYYCYLYYCY